MSDAMDYLCSAMDEVERLIKQNERLKAKLDAMNATSDETDRAEIIVQLRKDVLRWKNNYEFAVNFMEDTKK